MMFGSTFMLGFGLLAMVLVIGLPIALIVLLVWALTRKGNSSAPAFLNIPQKNGPAHFCSNCGTTLQPGWSNCPQCGAQV
jgi:hypothetical protein